LISYTRTEQSRPYLHVLVADTGEEHRRDRKEYGRTLFLDVAAAAASTPSPET
jgi:hypothetical protein